MKRVLIVEDEPLIAMDLADTLEELGFQVSGIAHAATEAILKADELRPDFVTLDLNLGLNLGRDMEGLDVARQLRQRGAIPIIFVTGHAGRDIGQFAASLGHATVALKPISSAALSRAISVAGAA